MTRLRGLELACTIAGHWRVHGLLGGGMRWLGEAIVAAPTRRLVLRAAIGALGARVRRGTRDEAIAHARTAIAMSEAAGDDHSSRGQRSRSPSRSTVRGPDPAAELYERALVAARKSDNEILVMQLLHNIATQKTRAATTRRRASASRKLWGSRSVRDDHEAIVIITQCLARLAVNRRISTRPADSSMRRSSSPGVRGSRGASSTACSSMDISRRPTATSRGRMPYYDELVEAERQAGDRSASSRRCSAWRMRKRTAA